MPVPVLIVEPRDAERLAFRKALPAGEFLLRFEPSGERGLECAFAWGPSLILLEVALAGLRGLEVCRMLKEDARTRPVPVCFVSAEASRADIVAGLKAGADEYLAKPFHPTELLWRARGLLRRFESARPASEAVLRLGSITIDTEQCLCSIEGEAVRLTPKEYALLESLARRAGRVVKRWFLLETIWGFDRAVGTRVVDLTLFRLRRKLGSAACRIETLPGFGYRFSVPPMKGRARLGKMRPE